MANEIADMKDRVIAVVVTYNRKALLMQCLAALFAQRYELSKIVLIDNASTDGTVEDLREQGFLDDPRLMLVQMSENTGGAGGFYEGMRVAKGFDADWVWVMDDDTIPDKGALEGLVSAAHSVDPRASFYASCVYGPEGEPMNVPNIAVTKAPNGYRDWYMQLPQKAVKIADATFVSLLISTRAIRQCGLPCKDYFIWGDDSEYTMRIIKHYGPAYLVGTSTVTHLRVNAKALSLREEQNKGRVAMYRFFYRNNLINRRLYAGRGAFLRFLCGAIVTSFGGLFKPMGGAKFKAVWKGIGGYIKQRNAIKAYIDNQLESVASE